MRSVNALAISSDGLHLYAGTEGGGTYRLDLNNEAPSSATQPTPIPLTPTVDSNQSATATPTSSSQPGTIPCGSALLLPVLVFSVALLLRRR